MRGLDRTASLYLGQLWSMTLCEWKLREQSTILGFLWTLLQPALTFFVLYALFTKWMGSRTPNYSSYLLIGIVEYGFFNAATTYGLTSLQRRSGILMNFKVPRELIVLSAGLSVALSFLVELGLMLSFACLTGAAPAASWLWAAPIVAVEVVFVLGLLLSLSIVAARYPDFARIWSIVTNLGFFLTPIFYTLDTISPSRQRLLLLNPMTHFIELTRACVLRGGAPAARDLGGLALLAVAATAAGYAFFKKCEPLLADFVLG